MCVCVSVCMWEWDSAVCPFCKHRDKYNEFLTNVTFSIPKTHLDTHPLRYSSPFRPPMKPTISCTLALISFKCQLMDEEFNRE